MSFTVYWAEELTDKGLTKPTFSPEREFCVGVHFPSFRVEESGQIQLPLIAVSPVPTGQARHINPPLERLTGTVFPEHFAVQVPLRK